MKPVVLEVIDAARQVAALISAYPQSVLDHDLFLRFPLASVFRQEV